LAQGERLVGTRTHLIEDVALERREAGITHGSGRGVQRWGGDR
jgi:hypothetical protein